MVRDATFCYQWTDNGLNSWCCTLKGAWVCLMCYCYSPVTNYILSAVGPHPLNITLWDWVLHAAASFVLIAGRWEGFLVSLQPHLSGEQCWCTVTTAVTCSCTGHCRFLSVLCCRSKILRPARWHHSGGCQRNHREGTTPQQGVFISLISPQSNTLQLWCHISCSNDLCNEEIMQLNNVQ